jgi:hypothetical protein
LDWHFGDRRAARAHGSNSYLTGLSCRFAPISTKHGVILSLIVVPRDDPTSFVELIQELLQTLRSDDPGLHPLPAEGRMLFWNASTIGRQSYVLCTITHAS